MKEENFDYQSQSSIIDNAEDTPQGKACRDFVSDSKVKTFITLTT